MKNFFKQYFTTIEIALYLLTMVAILCFAVTAKFYPVLGTFFAINVIILMITYNVHIWLISRWIKR